VNDPADPGGATNHGVTLGTLRRLGLDLTGDGIVTEADVRHLTRAQAVSIYVDHYFRRPGLDRLPDCLQASVFDMYVNAGANAVRLLQRLLGRMGFPCTEDGVIGPVTCEAALRAAEAAPDHLADAYAIARRNYYYRLADARPASRRFARRRDGGKGGCSGALASVAGGMGSPARLRPLVPASRLASLSVVNACAACSASCETLATTTTSGPAWARRARQCPLIHSSGASARLASSTRISVTITGPNSGTATRMNRNEAPHSAASASSSAN
jgi:hypothetical protein